MVCLHKQSFFVQPMLYCHDYRQIRGIIDVDLQQDERLTFWFRLPL